MTRRERALNIVARRRRRQARDHRNGGQRRGCFRRAIKEVILKSMRPSSLSESVHPYPSPKRQRLALAVVCLGSLLSPLDTTVNTAFPVITAAFSLPLRDIQWVVIAYVLAMSSFALIFGHLGDRMGHRRIFAMGLAACVLAHAAVALAPDFPSLVAMRAVQGAAAGMAVSCAPAIATLLYPAADKARVLALYIAVGNVAMAAGPWLGGLLLQAFGWPGVFWFRAPLALAALLLLPCLPKRPGGVGSSSSTSTARFDWAGAVGLSALLSSMMLGLAELTRPDANLWITLTLLAGGVVGTFLWVRHESRAAQPVLRMAPFRSARFSGTQAASVLVNLACFANLLLLPYELTRAAGASLASAGLMLSMYPGGSVLGSLVAGRLAARWSSSQLMTLGGLGAAAGLLLTGGLLSAGSPTAALSLGMLASGLGLGLFQVGYMEATTSMLPIDERGVAGSLVSVTRLLGILLGATGIHWLQGLTQNHASTFQVLGIGLLVLAMLFALGNRQATPP